MAITIARAALAGVLAIVASVVVAAEPPLVDAAKRSDTASVRQLLARGVDPDQPYGDGTTALHWAAYRNNLELATLLIRAGANVNTATDLGVTPLWLASTEADEALVQRLLQAGANPNATLPSGETPLMGAARVGHAGAVAALLATRAQVNARERSRGQTALMWAASQGHAAVVRLLTRAGADVTARTTSFSTLVNVRPQGFTNSGARAGLSVQAFDDRRPVSANTGSARTRQRAGGAGADDADASGVVGVEYGGYTPLFFAARQGGVEAARALIEARANVNDTAPDGTSALVVAAHSGHGALAAFLLEHGADANAAGAGYTALHMAILRKDLPLVKALLAHGADPRQPLLKGTPARRNATDLMLGGPLIGAQPAFIAARFNEPEIMRSIVRAGGDMTAVAPADGNTAIMGAMAGAWLGEGMAIPRGPVETEQRALAAIVAAVELGVDVNAVNAAGDTALHLAVGRGFESVVRFLVGKGASLVIPNQRGQTPRDLAGALKREGIVKVLANPNGPAGPEER